MISGKRKIHENIVGGFYGYLLLCISLITLNFFLYFAGFIVVALIFIFLMLMLISNRKISPDNFGFLAVAQMTSIVGMIAVYDYFSMGHDRLIFFLNFALGFSSAFFCYGLYFRVRDRI